MASSAQRWFYRRVCALTWLMYMVSYLHICGSYTIDQIISRAMRIPEGCGFMYDERRQMVRVDLDIVYTIEDWERLVKMNNTKHGVHSLSKRQAIISNPEERYWPDGIIYYQISPDFDRWDVHILKAAMEEWMKHTCVQFKPAVPFARNKIIFVDGDGCASSVGMIRYPQKVTLSRGCRVKGVVIHELGHVLGFNHEQTRPDRDRYVKIRWENIPRRLHYNFRQFTWNVVRDLGIPYDYLSIMHYGQDAFSGNGRATIETLDGRYQDLIGNRRGLSFRDIKAANILYNCRPSRERCSLRDEDCPGEGFVSKDCECWCPTTDIYSHPDTPYYVCSPTDPGHKTSLISENSGTSSAGGETPRGSSECKDQNVNCGMWAKRGECQNNPDYMHAYCRKACGLCDAVDPPCRDKYGSCQFWQERGYCGSPSLLSIFITSNCRRTCGLCKAGPGKEGGQGGKTRACERECEDHNTQCQEWAARGECSATADYMLRYCRKACNLCCSEGGDPASSTIRPQ